MRKTCEAEGCERESVAKGLCRKHYGRYWRKGHLKIGKDEIPTGPFRPRLLAILTEFKEAKIIYNNTVGIEGLMHWGQKIKELKEEATAFGIDLDQVSKKAINESKLRRCKPRRRKTKAKTQPC